MTEEIEDKTYYPVSKLDSLIQENNEFISIYRAGINPAPTVRQDGRLSGQGMRGSWTIREVRRRSRYSITAGGTSRK